MHRSHDIPSTPCRVIRIKKEGTHPLLNTKEVKEVRKKETPPKEPSIPVKKPTSMSSLILWNISKALELNPSLDLKISIKEAQQRLEKDTRDLNTVIAEHPEQQHLVCAMLAWQQLGHHDADSLYRFVQSKRNNIFTKCAAACMEKINEMKKYESQKTVHGSVKGTDIHCCHDPTASKFSNENNGSFGSHSSGPFVKLPVDTKLIMRLDNQSQPPRQAPRNSQRDQVDTMSKIDAACCLDTACIERLASLDATTKELRLRAGKLARREAERVELLERAEAAWKDLEIGYQRRLSLAEEKEDDINRQIQKIIAERNEFKLACQTLAEELKDRGDAVENERAVLTELEKQVCDRACTKMRLSEEVAKDEATLAEIQCRAAQYERDLQVLCTLAFLASGSYQKILCENARTYISQASASRAIRTVVDAINHPAIINKYIRFPQNTNERQILKEKFYENFKIPGTIGCVDGTLVSMVRPKEHEERYYCRKGYHARNAVIFKEEQARRKLITLDNEADSARALTHEAERALRAELSGLREQIAQVSNELLEEDEANVRIKEEHEQLRQEKMEMVEDLEGCKVMCDKNMQGRVDELKKKKEQLNGLKEQVMDCRCKMPVDATVEVKRTPSLAAMCRCAPEDKLLESCSCTSMRGRLLSNLLADLFGGLQTELGGSGSQMPCQLLKCLEDKHNWDRASVVKTNLRNFFSKLLMGELDIAIATSIENYHAKWVGESCADVAKMTPEPEDDLKEGWQQRALERRAQKMATELAEQLFQERAEQLAQRAKDIVTSGPPPCACKPRTAEAAVYSCMMPTSTPFTGLVAAVKQSCEATSTPAYFKRTIQDVTQLRLQIEDLKKDSIKKEDLKLMEEKITKIVKQSSAGENENLPSVSREVSNFHGESSKRDLKSYKTGRSRDESPRAQNKSGAIRKKVLDSNSFPKKSSMNDKPTKQNKKPIHGQSYAVNLCLCGIQKNGKNVHNIQLNSDNKSSLWKQKSFKEVIPQSSIVKQTKPIYNYPPSPEIDDNDSKVSDICDSNCKCFHKPPSNTSIDKLLETLTKWKCDLADPQEQFVKDIKSSLSKYSKTAIKESMHVSSQNDSKINLSISTESNKDHVSKSDKAPHKENKQIGSAQIIQPVTTESEYMGAVNLDKSNENVCKCIPDIDSRKENNQEKKGNGQNNIPIKCINSNACECKIYQEMQKDHKRSQTEERYKVEVLNQIQVCQTQDIPELKHKKISSKSINFVKDQNEMSDINNVTQNTELFPKNCEYYIKFLGVTLDDLSTHRKPKRIMKDVDHNAEDLLISKDKFVEHRRKPQRNIKPSGSFTKPKVIPIDEDEQNLFNKTRKCECNAKFEEFKMFMNTLFANQLQDNTSTRKDEGPDLQSFKYADNTLESCVCSNSFTMEDSKDLEVNAFHLLEDHLKGKLEEFKSYSCKSSCIPPEEEEKLFSAILQRVKQVISDCANELRCSCPGGLPNDGSWNRAYGLLQEYLKIKIKRVQCLCVLNNNKEIVLPEILDKVCNLIESDFQRLKDICKCKNNNDTRKKCVRIEDLDFSAKELPEKDTNISDPKPNYEIIGVQDLPVAKTSSKQISNKSMIITENISSQVPPNLGMKAKSCDIMELGNKNAQTTETDIIITDNKSNGVMDNKCDCCYNTDEHNFSEMFGTKEVLVNLYTDYEIRTVNTSCEMPKNVIDDGTLKCPANETNMTLNFEKKENDKSILNDKEVVGENNTHVPYIGYTVDCSCDGALGSCVCMKSVVQANNDKIDNIWKQFLSNCNNCNQDFSYIMQSAHNNESGDVVNYQKVPDDVVVSDALNVSEQKDDKKVLCETEVSVLNEGEIVLKNSHVNVNTLHHTTSTFDENFSLGASCTSESDWFECPVPMNSHIRPSTVKLTNSIYFPVPLNNYKRSFLSDTVSSSVTQKSSPTCDCDRVPICHVKMLVENIEKNLIESKCTCDSLISKVCPVHSNKIK